MPVISYSKIRQRIQRKPQGDAAISTRLPIAASSLSTSLNPSAMFQSLEEAIEVVPPEERRALPRSLVEPDKRGRKLDQSDKRSVTYGGVDEVLEDLLVHLLEGARARALLLDARDAGRLAHHAALGDEEDLQWGK